MGQTGPSGSTAACFPSESSMCHPMLRCSLCRLCQVESIQCRRQGDKRHRLVQINLAADKDNVITPAKERSQGVQLKRLLPESDWDRLKEVASLTGGGRAIVKLWAHHLACRANNGVRSMACRFSAIFIRTTIDQQNAYLVGGAVDSRKGRERRSSV